MTAETGASGWTRTARAADYAFAIAATLLATCVTLLVTRWLEDFPLLVLLTAVMASAQRGGTAPGLVATALSAVGIFAASRFLAEGFAIPRVNLGGEVARLVIFIVVASGISVTAGARQRAEAERDTLLLRERAAREEAEAASGAKDRLLAVVSHELRTPLSAILSWASLLREGDGGEHVGRALEAIVRNTKAQARLVDDLLDVSRIVTGKLRLDLGPTALGSVVEEAVEVVRPAADAKRIDLDVTLDDSVHPLMADPDRLRQVVWNLLSNAVKFTPEGGHVSVQLQSTGSHIEIQVTDNGPGMPSHLLPHLFEPFWQADTGTAERSGLGLGLAIVRHIVELHGGTIAADSEAAGKGMSFRIVLPVTRTGAPTTSSTLALRTRRPPPRPSESGG